MADFCLQCNVDLFFGPHSDFDGLSTPEDTANGLYCVVLCEGCGPCQVDHTGYCVSRDCLERHGDMAPGRSEVYRSAQRWSARRSGPLGPLLRLRDRFLGTPWDPGYCHFPGHPAWYVREFFSAIYEGRQMQRVAGDGDFDFFLHQMDEEPGDGPYI